METTQSNPSSEKSLKVVSVVLPVPLAHAVRVAAAQTGKSLSKYVRSLIEAALATATTVNSTSTDLSTDDAIVVAAAE